MPNVLLLALEVSMIAANTLPGAELDAAFRKLPGHTVVFGHQSVGANLLDGLQREAHARGVALPVVEVHEGEPIPPGSLAHAYVGTNGDPLAKLAAFERVLTTAGSPPPEVALFKLCWADFRADTDVEKVFAAYDALVTRLRARFPGTAFVHVTTPLTTLQGGPRALVKRIIGRPVGGEAENARREAYNALLRARYPEGEVFDLARLEAQDERGQVTSYAFAGRRVIALAPANTDDGGHLVPAAQERIARELVAMLAGVLRR